ncbi:uncharacterized protein LOC110442048 [Mizuhopecten yessoensis]|uniref:uncharacterized protein LOC110442048 n=1 Tax=Mizuhopecten yessoensis TaxID=6573 RepID=UPI000B45C1FC|nr:uncharacterized protein LOC110442048 [Mizuhopecten yessoensis]
MMDSTENERMSVLLSKYIERAFSLTQEEVDIRRKSYDSMENSEWSESLSVFRAGSTAEGLNLLGSDVDIMYILTDFIVMYPDQCIPPNMAHKTILYARAADCRPGYVFLQLPELQKSNHLWVTNALVRIEESMFVSSDIFREHIVSGMDKQIRLKVESNGPACTDTMKGGQYDNVMCFPCHSWPSEANEWITRTRLYGWPRQTLIDNIVHHGCHLVPVGDKCSKNTFLQWRFSFATAERSLVHSFSHIQFKVYTLLKYFLKQIKGILKETIGDDDILCSYFLKIILFHAIENSNQLLWQEKNLFYCFWFCFKILIAFVRAGFCPSYFIPANNLFKRKVHGQHQQILLDVLSNYHQMKWMCLSVGNFFKTSIWEHMCDSSIQAELVCPKTTQDTAYIQDRTLMCHLRYINITNQDASSKLIVFRKAINSLSTSQSESDELFTFTCAMQNLHDLATEQVYPEHMVATDNKTRYRSLRKCKHWMIRKASMGTELLHLATFHFLTGNFFKTLEMCKQVMKLASYYFRYRDFHPELQAMYSHLYHQFEHSSDRLKKMYTGILSFTKKGLYLPHLCQEILKEQTDVSIPPLPYALFLSFLCCHELGDTTGRDDALRLLIEVQSDDDQGGHKYWTVHTLLGICYQTLGDNHRAIRAYWDSAQSQAYDQIWNPAIERIAVVFLCMYVSQRSDRG